jgi:DNA-binding response OmpR family regulator
MDDDSLTRWTDSTGPFAGRVLVADDDPVMRQILEGFLSMREYTITLATNGAEALQAFEEAPYGLVITDWMMPELDGLELTRAIREMELHAYCYIILITSMEGHENKCRALDAGADAFLTKPFQADELELQLKVANRIQAYLTHIRRLESLMPVCCCCKRIRDNQQHWHPLDEYIGEQRDSRFHTDLCPDCLRTRVNPALIPRSMRPHSPETST